MLSRGPRKLRRQDVYWCFGFCFDMAGNGTVMHLELEIGEQTADGVQG